VSQQRIPGAADLQQRNAINNTNGHVLSMISCNHWSNTE
jgi:hypothetical protein